MEAANPQRLRTRDPTQSVSWTGANSAEELVTEQQTAEKSTYSTLRHLLSFQVLLYECWRRGRAEEFGVYGVRAEGPQRHPEGHLGFAASGSAPTRPV